MHTAVRSFGAAFTACALIFVAHAGAAKTIKLIVAGPAPPQVTTVKITKEYFIPEIDRRLKASGKDFKIEWTQAYAPSLVRVTETLEAVEEGIAHIGLQVVNFEESKLPLENISYKVPFGVESPAAATNALAHARRSVPAMDETWTKYNQIYLGGGAFDSTHIVAKFPLRKMEDLKGHKIGASGATGQFLKGSGATVVPAYMSGSFMDLKNGLYDGYVIAITLAFSFKTYEAAPYVTKVNFGASVCCGLSVNLDTWRSLPRFVRDIFKDA